MTSIVTEQVDRIQKHWLEVKSWVRQYGSFAGSEALILNKQVPKTQYPWGVNMCTSIVVCMRYTPTLWASLTMLAFLIPVPTSPTEP